jgi:hypothetical protein
MNYYIIKRDECGRLVSAEELSNLGFQVSEACAVARRSRDENCPEEREFDNNRPDPLPARAEEA